MARSFLGGSPGESCHFRPLEWDLCRRVDEGEISADGEGALVIRGQGPNYREIPSAAACTDPFPSLFIY